MDTIERVARAICKLSTDEYISNDPDYVIPAAARVDKKPIVTWRLFEDQARAAIEALRDFDTSDFTFTEAEAIRRFIESALGEKS